MIKHLIKVLVIVYIYYEFINYDFSDSGKVRNDLVVESFPLAAVVAPLAKMTTFMMVSTAGIFKKVKERIPKSAEFIKRRYTKFQELRQAKKTKVPKVKDPPKKTKKPGPNYIQTDSKIAAIGNNIWEVIKIGGILLFMLLTYIVYQIKNNVRITVYDLLNYIAKPILLFYIAYITFKYNGSLVCTSTTEVKLERLLNIFSDKINDYCFTIPYIDVSKEKSEKISYITEQDKFLEPIVLIKSNNNITEFLNKLDNSLNITLSNDLKGLINVTKLKVSNSESQNFKSWSYSDIDPEINNKIIQEIQIPQDTNISIIDRDDKKTFIETIKTWLPDGLVDLTDPDKIELIIQNPYYLLMDGDVYMNAMIDIDDDLSLDPDNNPYYSNVYIFCYLSMNLIFIVLFCLINNKILEKYSIKQMNDVTFKDLAMSTMVKVIKYESKSIYCCLIFYHLSFILLDLFNLFTLFRFLYNKHTFFPLNKNCELNILNLNYTFNCDILSNEYIHEYIIKGIILLLIILIIQLSIIYSAYFNFRFEYIENRIERHSYQFIYHHLNYNKIFFDSFVKKEY